MPKVGCSKRALPLLVIATPSLTACATASTRPSVICPPVAAYDRASRRGLPMKSSACRPARRWNRRCWTMAGCTIRLGPVSFKLDRTNGTNDTDQTPKSLVATTALPPVRKTTNHLQVSSLVVPFTVNSVERAEHLGIFVFPIVLKRKAGDRTEAFL